MSSSPSTSEASAIQLQQVSKKYPIYETSSSKLLELLSFRKWKLHRDFWALRDISLAIPKGATLGVVGRNGSGKSTLLQVLAGILRPTTGSCQVQGSVAAILELGAGFNPEFSGRENIFINAAVLGLSHRQTHDRMDRILDFAGIGEFIDQPVKIYSSGMFVRLAFSVAVHVDPEILLVDEALAVGDLVFQHRCIHRMRQLRDAGKTIVLVTHDLHAVTSYCSSAILLDGGRKLHEGSPATVVQRYQALVARREADLADGLVEKSASPADNLPVVRTIPYIHNRYGEGAAEIIGIILLSSDGEVLTSVPEGGECSLLVSVHFKQQVADPIVGFTVRDRLGNEMTSSNTSYEGIHLPDARVDQIYTIAFRFRVPALRPGSYTISPAVSRGDIWEHTVEDWIDNAYIFNLLDTGLVYGQMRWPVDIDFQVSIEPRESRTEEPRVVKPNGA